VANPLRDDRLSLRWLTQAAEQSLPEAWYRLAQRTDNEEKSVYWYTRAALAGHTAAKVSLASAFLVKGLGRKRKGSSEQRERPWR
jgi:TPR repeat protein